MFCYIVPRTKGKAELAKAFFEKQGMTVVDLTVAQPWEPEQVVVPVTKPAPAKPRKKGLPKLSGILLPDGRTNHGLIISDDLFPRIEDPEYIVKMNPRAGNAVSNLHPHLNAEGIRMAIKLYGDKGGVVVNDNQYARFKKMGAVTFDNWLIQRIQDEILTNPRLQTFYSMRLGALPREVETGIDWTSREFLKVILGEPRLAKEFGLVHSATKEDRMIFSIFQSMMEYSYSYKDKLKLAVEHVAAVKPDPKLKATVDKLCKSKLIGYLNSSKIETLFESLKTSTLASTPKHVEGVMDLLLYAIEG
jgi:hypothetical protein